MNLSTQEARNTGAEPSDSVKPPKQNKKPLTHFPKYTPQPLTQSLCFTTRSWFKSSINFLVLRRCINILTLTSCSKCASSSKWCFLLLKVSPGTQCHTYNTVKFAQESSYITPDEFLQCWTLTLQEGAACVHCGPCLRGRVQQWHLNSFTLSTLCSPCGYMVNTTAHSRCVSDHI